MKNIIAIELNKAVKNCWFVISLSFGLLCVILSLCVELKMYYSDMGIIGRIQELEQLSFLPSDDLTKMVTLYNTWIGATNKTLGHSLFYTLAPLLAVLPCGWIFTEEITSGYLHMTVPLCGRRRYFTAKMAAYFIAGGLIILLPQLISLLLTALFIPANKPNILYLIYYGIQHGTMLSGLFYSRPVLYLLTILGIDFIFGGLYAWLSMAFALLTGNRLGAVILPFLFLLTGDMAKNLLLWISYLEISPLNILHPLSVPNYIKGWIVLAWIGIFLAISVPILLRKGDRYEIF